MLSKGLPGTLDSLLSLSKALLLLDELKPDEVDAVVVDHVRALLADGQQTHQEIALGYNALLRQTLEAFAAHVAGIEPVLEKHLRMVLLRVTPPLPAAELKSLHAYMPAIVKRVSLDNDVARSMSFVSADLTARATPLIIATAVTAPKESGADVGAEAGNTGQKSGIAMRDQLNQKNQEFSQIRTTLSRHVNEAIAQNQEFGVLLGVELDALRDAERIQDVEKRRVTLINEINKFVKKHRLLSDKFDNANKYLNLVESSNQQLSDELDRVRLLSLTDELTGLPNRRAFLRRMEDEVGRVKRYGVPVSVTIIDLDGFKAINDLRGHGGGDAVLRGYAEQILSVFRHHDMVARYGGEEFAVVLPNTGRDGALRALQKVQGRVSEVVCTHSGERFPMPTFSAGLAEYRHGETLSDFVERADAALYRAKRMGRNRIEIARESIDGNGSVDERGEDLNAARHA